MDGLRLRSTPLQSNDQPLDSKREASITDGASRNCTDTCSAALAKLLPAGLLPAGYWIAVAAGVCFAADLQAAGNVLSHTAHLLLACAYTRALGEIHK